MVSLTVLTGGIVSAVIVPAWPYFLALIAWKTVYDVLDESRHPRGEHPAANG